MHRQTGGFLNFRPPPPLPKVLQKIAELDAISPPTGHAGKASLLPQSNTLGAQAAATIYECGILSGSKLSGMQRRRFFASCANKWNANMKGLNVDDRSPSAWIHKTLYNLTRACVRV